MKIIISHDVDHIAASEHRYDLVIPKFIGRSILEFCYRKITYSELIHRVKSLENNKMQNIDELMAFNNKEGIPATFFVGVACGKGLSYPLSVSKFWINKILRHDFAVGVHGIAYEDEGSIRDEYELFKSISGINLFGIRMHYLRNTAQTSRLLSKVGYLYDASEYRVANPFMVGSMWEFPIQIMEGRIFQNKRIVNKPSLQYVKNETIHIIEKARENGINYFTILFHDRYFSPAFLSLRNWYVWLIKHLKNERYEFVDYLTAVKEQSR